ncbi:unnamed protein product [Danaus chrysippus]|uniref:(African queen) hypothetical protein n=1 Tax=Danaus chrysippus TaxID=151541 RepID=A0A8J2QFW2_9NEOP|nr:unnamed protein product [Danaus chrysippus]
MRSSTVKVLMLLIGLSMVLSSQGHDQVYCGRRLAMTLAMLCDNSLIKRSEPQYIPESSFTFPWISSHRAHSMGRSKRQVVSECCDKPCSVDELLAYCGY